MGGILHPAAGPHPIHTVHRVSIGLLGAFLLIFGVLGWSRHLGFLDARGAMVMGLSSNGLLATVSVIVAVILLGAAIRGGPTASSVGVVFGTLFLLVGLVNTLLLGSAMNMLAFRLPNVIFSVAVGALLLFIGAYGRLAGGLPTDSPYYHRAASDHREVDERDDAERHRDDATDVELAEAERAVATHTATPAQLAGVGRAAMVRTAADRRQAWREALARVALEQTGEDDIDAAGR